MESRNISITLKKAREWYNSGSADLREVALQAYTKDELEIPEWQNIKTFEDACKALHLDMNYVDSDIESLLETNYISGCHLIAIYKLDIICKALNKGWKPSMVEGKIYYPYVRFYPAGLKAIEAVSSNSWKLGESFIADGKKYTLVGGGCGCFSCVGLAYFGCGYGVVQPARGLLGCKSEEIAEHISRYFMKEIFEAVYSQYIGLFTWC